MVVGFAHTNTTALPIKEKWKNGMKQLKIQITWSNMQKCLLSTS